VRKLNKEDERELKEKQELDQRKRRYENGC
jgi:hypothetical protein